MKNLNAQVAETFYKAMGSKDLERLASMVADDIHFIGPLAELKGKDAYLAVVKNFIESLDSLNIRTVFASEDQGMAVYDAHFKGPIGVVRGAALLDIMSGIITRAELFYDARQAETKREEIFS